MWLQLGAHLFRPCMAGGTVRRYVPVTPWATNPGVLAEAYQTATWRREDMPLIEFIRKTNPTGAISHTMRRRWHQEKTHEEE
eukprot:1053101-Amphidinium_carterae.1